MRSFTKKTDVQVLKTYVKRVLAHISNHVGGVVLRASPVKKLEEVPAQVIQEI